MDNLRPPHRVIGEVVGTSVMLPPGPVGSTQEDYSNYDLPIPGGATQAIGFNRTQPSYTDGKTLVDESGNNNVGRLIDGSTLTFSTTGTDTTIDLPVTSSSANQISMSGSLWFRPTVTAGQNLFLERNGANNLHGVVALGTGAVRLDHRDTATRSYTTTATYTINVWNHFAWTIDKINETVTIWLNGTEESAAIAGGQNVFHALTTDTLTVGATPAGGSGLSGQLTDLRIWHNKIITSAEALRIHTSKRGLVPTTSNSKDIWLWIQEGGGATCFDGSGNRNHGALNIQSGAWSNLGESFLTAYNGFDGATFFGSGSYITTPTAAGAEFDFTKPWEWTFDLCHDSEEQCDCVFSTVGSWAFRISTFSGSTGDIFFNGSSNNINAWRNFVFDPIPLHEFINIKVTWDGVDTVEVFFDGVSQGTKTLSAPGAPAGDLTLGRNGTASPEGSMKNHKLVVDGVTEWEYPLANNADDISSNGYDGTNSGTTIIFTPPDTVNFSNHPGIHNKGGYKIDFTDAGGNSGGSTEASYEWGDGDGATLTVIDENVVNKDKRFYSTT
jgi:hypothetical protein